jgi:hypothetical protein
MMMHRKQPTDHIHLRVGDLPGWLQQNNLTGADIKVRPAAKGWIFVSYPLRQRWVDLPPAPPSA